MRECGLITIRKRKTAVLRQQLMQMSGTTAPMTQDKKRRLNAHISQQRAVTALFASANEAVLHTLVGNRERAERPRRVDGEVLIAQQPEPLPESDAAHETGS